MACALLDLRAVVVLAAAFSLAVSQTPVPVRPSGYIYQTSTGPKVVIETFYDHLCIDSKTNWPILKQVFDAFSVKDVTAIIHIFPLPYHHNAYFMQQASVVVRQTDPTQFVKFMELVFQYQDMFLSGAVNMTEPEVQRTIAEFISQHISVAYSKVMEGFTDDVVTMDARYAWKYAASRSVTGTPQFIVNGVHVPAAPGFSAGDWAEFIDSLLNTPTALA